MSSRRRRQTGAPAGHDEPAPRKRMPLPVRIASSSVAGNFTTATATSSTGAGLGFASLDSRLYLIPGFSAAPPTCLAVLDQQLLAQFNSGEKAAMITGNIIFSDDSGKYKKQFCRWLQPPAPQIVG